MCTEYVFIVKEILEPSEAEKQKKKGRKEEVRERGRFQKGLKTF
jgi:hypothetical protein